MSRDLALERPVEGIIPRSTLQARSLNPPVGNIQSITLQAGKRRRSAVGLLLHRLPDLASGAVSQVEIRKAYLSSFGVLSSSEQREKRPKARSRLNYLRRVLIVSVICPKTYRTSTALVRTGNQSQAPSQIVSRSCQVWSVSFSLCCLLCKISCATESMQETTLRPQRSLGT